MTNETAKLELEQIKTALENMLNASEYYWEQKTQSHAFIVGYLQGGIKTIIKELEHNK